MGAIPTDAASLREWLFETALPLWWEVGADRSGGGYHEAIDLDGRAVVSPRRARTIARQVFAYCEAGRLGWNGPWRDAAWHALDYFRRHFIADDATAVSVVGLDGRVSDPAFDLYNQAFALLAYANGHQCFGAETGCRDDAVALRATLERAFAHPDGGFLEGRTGRLPQRSNPHMHLLEAALAWVALDDDPAWRAMAEGLARLCLERFVEPMTGALREFFGADWSPAPGVAGRIVEPGHQYEWAFLLDRRARQSRRQRPQAVAQLIAFADTHGLDARRGVAINSVLTQGAVHDPVARLWAQAERIRAYAIDRAAGQEPRLADAVRGLGRFLATPTPGLWFDQLTADDRFIAEPARATSLYHIIGAVAELSVMSHEVSSPVGPSATGPDPSSR